MRRQVCVRDALNSEWWVSGRVCMWPFRELVRVADELRSTVRSSDDLAEIVGRLTIPREG